MAFAPASPLALEGLPKFLSMSYHHFMNWAVFTFAELGIADRLIHATPGRGLTIAEIITDDQQQWNSELLSRLLRTCVYAGIVQLIHDDEHYILTESGIVMTSDHPSHVRDHIRFIFGPVTTGASQQFHKIVHHDDTGLSVTRYPGGLGLLAVMTQPDQRELLSIFSGAMTTYSMQAGSKLVVGVAFDRFKTIVDLGGSRGTFLAQILQHYPSIEHGIVFDLPQVINQSGISDEFTSRDIHKDRWGFISGDLLDSSTIPPADAYVLKHVLHDFNDEKCLKILSSIRQASVDRQSSLTTIFIVEHIILTDGMVSNWQTQGMDMAMAVLSENARERTQSQYEKLLNTAGFEVRKQYSIQAPDSIIEAVFDLTTQN